MSLRFGYGTNGFASHRLDDALDVIAGLGYDGVGLTIDHPHLDPFAPDLVARTAAVRRRLDRHGLAVVVETGARYVLDPWNKHEPTLVSDASRDRRVDLLCRAVRIAADLGAEAVSFWSGTLPEGIAAEEGWRRLLVGVDAVLTEAERRDVVCAFEPEPGMFVDTVAGVLELRHRLGSPERLRVTVDIGHCVCNEPGTVADCVHAAGPLLANVQLDDMVPGAHEHLEFGVGEVDLPAALGALLDVGYSGLAAVELPRHAHAAPTVAARSLEALRTALAQARSERGAGTSVTTSPSCGGRMSALVDDLAPHLDTAARARLDDLVRELNDDPRRISVLFPAVGRRVARGPSAPDDPDGVRHPRLEDEARVVLLGTLADAWHDQTGRFDREVAELYRYGDADEKRGVLRALSAIDPDPGPGSLPLVDDALRTNDVRLVAAALVEYGARHLGAEAWRQGVLKCLFVGVPLDAVARLDERADVELARMVADYCRERTAAGRSVPTDAGRVLDRFPGADDVARQEP